MTFILPTTQLDFLLDALTDRTLTLKLYSNNVIPDEEDDAASFTEVAGGGYSSQSIAGSSWSIADGVAVSTAKNFAFTGVTDSPGTVYGYFIVDSLGVLVGAERFSESVLPFIPGNGKIIRITPRVEANV